MDFVINVLQLSTILTHQPLVSLVQLLLHVAATPTVFSQFAAVNQATLLTQQITSVIRAVPVSSTTIHQPQLVQVVHLMLTGAVTLMKS
jgi:hypothetical protein